MNDAGLLRQLRIVDARMHRREERVRDLMARIHNGDESVAPSLSTAVAELRADVELVRDLTARCRTVA